MCFAEKYRYGEKYVSKYNFDNFPLTGLNISHFDALVTEVTKLI